MKTAKLHEEEMNNARICRFVLWSIFQYLNTTGFPIFALTFDFE